MNITAWNEVDGAESDGDSAYAVNAFWNFEFVLSR